MQVLGHVRELLGQVLQVLASVYDEVREDAVDQEASRRVAVHGLHPCRYDRVAPLRLIIK